MKTTLNLGSFAFDFDSKADRTFSSDMHSIVTPQNNMTAKVELKDVSITFEASVEETIEDIKASLEVVKELKNLASEFGNLFAGLEAKRQERRSQEEVNSVRDNFEKRYTVLENKIDEARGDIENTFRKQEIKISGLEDTVVTIVQRLTPASE